MPACARKALAVSTLALAAAGAVAAPMSTRFEAATELRAQPVIVRTAVRLPTVAIMRTNGMPISCRFTGPPGFVHETRFNHSVPRVVAREISIGRRCIHGL